MQSKDACVTQVHNSKYLTYSDRIVAQKQEKMSRSFLILLLISVNAMNEFGAALAADECDTNSDCESSYFNRVCCRGYASYTSRSCRHDSCAGRYCWTDGDCGGKGECCQANKCVTNGCTECHSNFDCSSSEYCCELRYTSDHNVCRRNCIGQTCHSNSDCGGPNEECDSSKKCAKSTPTTPSVAEDECNANSDCKSSYFSVCCRGYYSYTRRSCIHNSCAGRYCSTDGDCGGKDECCKFNKCVTNGCTECYSNSVCYSGEYCCKLRYTLDHNVCRRNCIGQTCHSNSDCGGPNEECDSNKKCVKSTSSSAAWVAPVVVIIVVLFLVLFGGGFSYRWCKSRPARRGVVVEAPAPQRTTAIIALRETEVRTTAPPPVYNYPPPAYDCPPPAYYNQGRNYPPPTSQLAYPPPQPLQFASP